MEENTYQYKLDKDGNRIMTDESNRNRILSLFGNLYPFEVDGKSMYFIGEILKRNINVDEPTVIICSEDIHKSVFGSILKILYESKWKNFISWTQVHVDHATQQFINGDKHDVSEEFSMYDVLFVTVNFGEAKNYLHPHMVRNFAVNRKLENKKTFFFFYGTKSNLNSRKWQIDEYNEGKNYIPLTNYVKVCDLNPVLNKINISE